MDHVCRLKPLKKSNQLQGHQDLSYKLFEWTFGLKVNTTIEQKSTMASNHTELTQPQREKLQLLTRYEHELYSFAREIFFKRVQLMEWDHKWNYFRK